MPQEIDMVDTSTEDESDSEKDKRTKRKAAVTEDHEHCDVNFVKNTTYKLLLDDTDKIWAEAILTDPSPPVPASRADTTNVGDYVLIKGSDVVLKAASTRGKKVNANFPADEELVLASDWDQMDGDMTGQDLVDLGDKTFLLWWQNVQPPPVKKTKGPTTTAIPRRKAKRKS
jgi:hypothetical protein